MNFKNKFVKYCIQKCMHTDYKCKYLLPCCQLAENFKMGNFGIIQVNFVKISANNDIVPLVYRF